MEPWQETHIQRNISDLIRLTNCDCFFLGILREHYVLDDVDVSRLEAVKNHEGSYAESKLLYNILITREGAYNALIDACTRAKKTGSLRILKQARPDGTILCFREQHIKVSSSWNELSKELKIEMRNKLVNFQGKHIKLSQLCDNQLEHLIDGKIMVEVVKGNIPLLINNQVPDQVEYYIHRTIRSRNRLKSNVFQETCNDVFVVEGVEKHELTYLVGEEDTGVSGNQTERLTVRFIFLEDEGNFEKICILATTPVHWIRYKDNVFKWVKSSGSVKSLQKYVDEEQECSLEGKLVARPSENKITVISDSPGMGKTILLANVAHQISSENPSILIRFIVMKELVQALHKKEINLDSIVSYIAEQSSEFECGRKLVASILKASASILLFDGFDEVLLHQVPSAKQILQEIRYLKSAHIFVATRPHMREELENTLNVLGYTMNPFEKPDKTNFLLKFWEMKGAKVNENLRQFSESCVEAISSKMSDFERDIAGIPLQCRLLAETYAEQAIKCSKLEISEDLQSQPIGAIHSIFEMYERHMKMRFEKICTESFLTRFAFRLVNKKSKTEAIKNVHVYYALELLFRDHIHLFPSLNTPPISMNELCALGFLEVTQSTEIRFVHRTFAEFFVAWFAVEMEMSGENTLPFLLNQLLATKSTSEFITTPVGKLKVNGFSFNYPVITYFINGFTKLYSRNCENKSQIVSTLMDSVHFSKVFRIFNASAISNYQFVPLAVSLCFETCSSKINNTNTAESNIYELLLITAKYSDVDLMKLFCSQRDLTKVKSLNFGLLEVTPLHVAVERGHYHLVEYLVRKYGNALTKLNYLLHFCVFESFRNKKKIVDDKIQIIKLLRKKNIVWLDEQLPDKKTPLLQTNVNLELVKLLIECGADVNVYDKKQNTILHKITENPVTPEFYGWIIVKLSERKFTLFNHPNLKQLTPLHCAVRQVELFEETLKFFKASSTNFNAVDENKESPLFYAIRGGRSLKLIKTLIQLGSECKHENKNLENVLHICAKHAHPQAMEYFINSHNINVKLQDIDGNTPLRLAVMRRSEEYELMQRLLIIASAAAQKYYDDHEQTPLKISSKLGKGLSLSVINLMEEHGLDINPDVASDTLQLLISNRNIMSWEIDNEFVKVLEFLIEKGGEIRPIELHYDGQPQNNVWESEGVTRNIPAIVKTTDFTRLWSHPKTRGLLTHLELELIQNLATDSSVDKCQSFFDGVQTIKGSFERLCILMIKSNQLNSFLLLRQALYSSLQPYYGAKMFVTPTPFVNQFIHSQKLQSNNVMTLAVLTQNPYFTIWRLGETINEDVVTIQEPDIESHLKKYVHDDVIVLKVRVVTTHLINIVERSEVQGKTLFVCNQVSDDIENCKVTTDSPTWVDISTRYLYKKAMFYFFNSTRGYRVHQLFASSQIFSIISQKPFIDTFPLSRYNIVRIKVGHEETQELKYLCQTVFHCVLEDKLVFQGITKDELKKYAPFGQRIGHLREDDVENLDYIILENSQQSQQFEEICQETFSNVHLIQHNQGSFKLVRTWGYEENIQWFFQNHICQFPTCNCESTHLVVRLTLQVADRYTTHRFECSLPIHDLAPLTLRMLELEDAEELSNLTALLVRLQESSVQNEDLHLQNKSHSEQIVHLVNSKLGGVLVEQELYQVAMNTLFPTYLKNTQIRGLEKYVQAGMLKRIDNNLIVFVYPTLAWYFIAKLLIESEESEEFIEITRELTTNLLQDCFQSHKVKMCGKHCIPYDEFDEVLNFKVLISFKFINSLLFTFVNSLLKPYNANGKRFKDLLKTCISTKSFLLRKWIDACVNANLSQLLQLLMSFNVELEVSKSEFEELVELAINHGDVPTIRVILENYFNKTRKPLPLANIKVYLGPDYVNVSLLHFGALRGNYEVIEYLLDDVKFGFKDKLQKSDKGMQDVLHCCVFDTVTKSGYEVNETKRIVTLLLEHDNTLLEKRNKDGATSLLVPNINADLITHLINLGVDVHATDNCGNNILHRCPEYLTPHEYHDVVQGVYEKEGVNMVRLFKEWEKQGGTAFHRAVEHLEVLDSTLQLFSSVGVDFNALNRMKDTVFVHAVKHYRSARLLDTLNKFGANIHQRDYLNRRVSEYCRNNLTALRYWSSRGDSMPPAGDTDTSVKAQNRNEFEL
ncbi:unnamed protein product [Orchesella dallaii]|uniref:NACHT domain-containing protein n=1 Tax=Orchesella dallaii TaxID=48710 RepID=A0ABP1RCB7_9HEXA